MSNGCICCTLREDLLKEVENLAKEGKFDYILIESTGVAEPVPVAQTFSYVDEENGIDLTKYTRLDTMVTVVDGFRFWIDFASGDLLIDRKEAVSDEDDRSVVDLLIDQIEFADVIILNKTDKLDDQEKSRLRAMITRLNPVAKLIESQFGKIDPKEILNTGLFDFDEASRHAGWVKELEKPYHVPETDEYGIRSFVYRSQLPFHPERLTDWMNDFPEEVIRSKGNLWLATRNDYAISFSQAGPSVMVDFAGTWVATASQEEQEFFFQENPDLKERFHPEYGDRMTEIVFIGMDMDQSVLASSLDQCLLTGDELAMDWVSFPDPFPLVIDFQNENE